jgi:7-cyano-7-deazaguanine synthase in queuosine biosynthesis
LEFVSGDLWEIGFTHARMQFGIGFLPFTKQWQPLDSNPIICLYSGGLDSAAGLVRRIGEVSSQEIVPLLVRHQSSQEIQVEGQILAIKLAKGIELRPLILPFWMQQPEKLAKEETTQRSRSFLFCSAGGVAGAILHAEAIELMESGIGAINVPLMTGMVGSKATHSSHPSFLKSFSELLNMVADREIAVRLPHLFLTKAELVKSLVDAGLAELIGKTSSCVHYPLRDPEVRQCGICPACIFRRQAIWAAGAKDQDREYEYDLFSAASGSIPAKKMGDIKAFLWQVEKLSPLDHSNQLPDFVLRHLRATGLTSNVDPPSDAVIDLCRRYRREWMALLEVGLREEWAWTKMMGPVPATVI